MNEKTLINKLYPHILTLKKLWGDVENSAKKEKKDLSAEAA